MATAGYEAKIEIKNATDITSFTEITEATNITVDLDNQLINVSTLGDSGMRRIAGRADANVSFDVNHDHEDSEQDDIFDALDRSNEEEITTRVYPNRNNTNNYIEAVCRVQDASLDLSGGSENTTSFTFVNSDGNAWSFNTA